MDCMPSLLKNNTYCTSCTSKTLVDDNKDILTTLCAYHSIMRCSGMIYLQSYFEFMAEQTHIYDDQLNVHLSCSLALIPILLCYAITKIEVKVETAYGSIFLIVNKEDISFTIG